MPRRAARDNNYRVYTAAHAERLAFIRHCRNLDMALDEIRSLLRLRDARRAGLRRGQRSCWTSTSGMSPTHPRVARAARRI
jgi:DNA-binding transcriptional MerR regulator